MGKQEQRTLVLSSSCVILVLLEAVRLRQELRECLISVVRRNTNRHTYSRMHVSGINRAETKCTNLYFKLCFGILSLSVLPKAK